MLFGLLIGRVIILSVRWLVCWFLLVPCLFRSQSDFWLLACWDRDWYFWLFCWAFNWSFWLRYCLSAHFLLQPRPSSIFHCPPPYFSHHYPRLSLRFIAITRELFLLICLSLSLSARMCNAETRNHMLSTCTSPPSLHPHSCMLRPFIHCSVDACTYQHNDVHMDMNRLRRTGAFTWLH